MCVRVRCFMRCGLVACFVPARLAVVSVCRSPLSVAKFRSFFPFRIRARLTKLGRSLGVVDDARWAAFEEDQDAVGAVVDALKAEVRTPEAWLACGIKVKRDGTFFFFFFFFFFFCTLCALFALRPW